jgi:hypothetical protein
LPVRYCLYARRLNVVGRIEVGFAGAEAYHVLRPSDFSLAESASYSQSSRFLTASAFFERGFI